MEPVSSQRISLNLKAAITRVAKSFSLESRFPFRVCNNEHSHGHSSVALLDWLDCIPSDHKIFLPISVPSLFRFVYTRVFIFICLYTIDSYEEYSAPGRMSRVNAA